jgi:RND superfamily putative drug exporter
VRFSDSAAGGPEDRPMTEPRKNLAARMGAWSASNRKKAIWGWLAFVLIATVLGGAVGTKQLEPVDAGNGESQIADRAVEDAGFPSEAVEQILVQGRGGVRASDPQVEAAVRDVVRRLQATPGVAEIRSPLDPANRGQVSGDGRSVIVAFDVPGEEETVEDRVAGTLEVTKAVQAAHPDVRVEQFGGASASKALSDALAEDFEQAETLSIPVTLIILVVAFGALVAAGLPLLLGATAVAGTIGLLGPLSQIQALEGQVASVVLLVGWPSASTTRCSTSDVRWRSATPVVHPRRPCTRRPRRLAGPCSCRG